MSKVQSLSPVKTKKEKGANKEGESCIILRKGQKVKIGCTGSGKKGDDKGE